MKETEQNLSTLSLRGHKTHVHQTDFSQWLIHKEEDGMEVKSAPYLLARLLSAYPFIMEC